MKEERRGKSSGAFGVRRGGVSLRALAAMAAATVLAGCFSYTSPYDYAENWLIREDPVRTFVIPADVIYLQNDLYLNVAHVPLMLNYAQSEVGHKRFKGLARVFSPLVASKEDLELALKWYFKYHHTGERPFIFIGEGEGGKLLHDYEKENEEDLKDDGLVASFYTEDARKGFVTDEMVRQIKEAVQKARFRAVWGKDMPEGMLKE